jgi:hypothetical protein
MAVITRLERKSRRWEQVWQGESETVASIVAGRLQTEGIQTKIRGHTAPSRTFTPATGGAWGILVPTGKAERARDVLRENDEAHNIIQEEAEEGLTGDQRMTLRLAIQVTILVASVVGMLVVWEMA